MRIEDVLAAIDAKQAEVAKSAILLAPGPDLDQRLMRAIGVHAGLNEARAIILGMYKDKAAKDHDL